jgi:cytidylate kinase
MNQIPDKLVIAIDGHSSSGKSTFAKAIASELGLLYIDSGAMYRAVTWYGLQNGSITDSLIDEKALVEQLDAMNIEFIYNRKSKRHETILNGINIEDQIRQIYVSQYVSPVSKIGMVREKLVSLQRSYAKNTGVVMDGRDIGTVVFPEADIKIFLVSNVNIRAERRFKELDSKGQTVPFDEVKANITDRDHQDSTRELSPLKKAEDAMELDNSNLTVAQQMTWFRELLKQKYPVAAYEKKHNNEQKA